ncbi:hypothetical protein [Candidatus Magnetobacterium casense]|nr:hypothetical protein [Candidatus Magnetobacterium casensis]
MTSAINIIGLPDKNAKDIFKNVPPEDIKTCAENNIEKQFSIKDL